jgi:hypothetical protein
MLSGIVEFPFASATAVPKVQDDPVGSPAQLQVSGWLKPLDGITVRVVTAFWPPDTVTLEGEAPIVKSGWTIGEMVTVVDVEAEAIKPGLPE